MAIVRQGGSVIIYEKKVKFYCTNMTNIEYNKIIFYKC